MLGFEPIFLHQFNYISQLLLNNLINNLLKQLNVDDRYSYNYN